MRRAERPRNPDTVTGVVEGAKRELLTAAPSPRGVPARQFADALLAFEERLREALEMLSAWPSGSREALVSAIEEALRRAERLRLDPPALDYEALVTILADLIEPLDAFADEH